MSNIRKTKTIYVGIIKLVDQLLLKQLKEAYELLTTPLTDDTNNILNL